MSLTYLKFRYLLKQLSIAFLSSLPLNWIEWLIKLNSIPNFPRLVRLGLRNRNLTISEGVGKGLKFNTGVADSEFALGTYELPVQEVLAKYLKPGDIFYDIGANIGFFSVIAAKLVTSCGHVYAFEPVRENAACIRRNIKLNNFSQISVLEKAVSNSVGEGEMLLTLHPGGHALSTVCTPPDLKSSFTVELVSIDDLLAQKKLLPPNLVKIDVEGAELNVLKGMKQTIQQFKPIIIYEVDDGNEKSLKQKSQEIETFISSFGYKIMPLADAYPLIQWCINHTIAIPQ
jgi:FkbM family methyltransferase